MIKISTSIPLRKSGVDCNNPSPKDSSHHKKISEFKRVRSVGSRKSGWTNLTIARHLVWSNVAIRRYWQEWVSNGRYQSQKDSGPSTCTTEREERATVKADVTSLDSSLSTIHGIAHAHMSPIWPWADVWESEIYALADCYGAYL